MIKRRQQLAQTIIPIVILFTWGFLLLHMLWQGWQPNYWLQQGDALGNSDPALALDYYDRALEAGVDPAELAPRYFDIQRNQAIHPTAQNIYLLADVEQNGWTTASRRQYTNFLGDHLAIEFFLSDTNELIETDLAGLWVLLNEDIHQLDWLNARDHLQQILTLHPDDTRANYILGLLLAIEDSPSAIAYLDIATLDPLYSFNAGQVQQMVALKLTDETVTALSYYQSLGEVLLDGQEWGLAEYAFSQAIAADNFAWTSYMYRGYVRGQLEQDGLSDLETAVALAPNLALPYYFLGLYWRGNERWDFAHEAFAKAYLLDPKNPALAIQIAQTYQGEGNYEEASNWYQVAVSLEPENSDWVAVQTAFYAETAYALEDEGLSIVETAYTQFPDDAEVVTSLGRVYFLLERYEEAGYHISRAVSLDSNNPRARYYYGLFLEAQGDTGGARFAYQDVIRMVGNEAGYGLLAARKLEQLGQ